MLHSYCDIQSLYLLHHFPVCRQPSHHRFQLVAVVTVSDCPGRLSFWDLQQGYVLHCSSCCLHKPSHSVLPCIQNSVSTTTTTSHNDLKLYLLSSDPLHNYIPSVCPRLCPRVHACVRAHVCVHVCVCGHDYMSHTFILLVSCEVLYTRMHIFC